MTTVVLQLRDEDLVAGRVVGRVEVIRAGGAAAEASTIRDLADLTALLFGASPDQQDSGRAEPVEEPAVVGRGLDAEFGEGRRRVTEDS